METQCLSKVWKTEKKQIRQGTSKRKETDWELWEKKKENEKKEKTTVSRLKTC